MSDKLPFIETSVYKRLEWQVRHLLATSGLGIARGQVGIGKSYSIQHLKKVLMLEGIKVQTTISTPTTEGSHNAFLKSFLSNRQVYERGTVDSIEVFERCIMGEPFGYPQKPAILIVDESQGMRAPVLTMLRQLWDKGDQARMNRRGDAFALLLCGNHTFMNRSGAVREMDLLPLRDRITMNVKLKPPSGAEIQEIAAKFCPHDTAAARVLAEYAKGRGNVRAIAQAFREATELAGETPISAQDVKDAINIMGGV